MKTLKAYWAVTAAIIPGQEIKELTKVWEYTSEDYEKDCGSAAALRGCEIFLRMRSEANEYAESLQDPSEVNTVNLQFAWV